MPAPYVALLTVITPLAQEAVVDTFSCAPETLQFELAGQGDDPKVTDTGVTGTGVGVVVGAAEASITA